MMYEYFVMLQKSFVFKNSMKIDQIFPNLKFWMNMVSNSNMYKIQVSSTYRINVYTKLIFYKWPEGKRYSLL